MKTNKTDVLPAPPRLIPTLISGFDSVTNHIGIVLFPVTLDLLLWWGPHLRIKNQLESFFASLMATPGIDTPDMMEVLKSSQEIWSIIAERFNLLVFIRSYPVGIPSLMASRKPLLLPGGQPVLVEINSFVSVLMILFLFTLIGLVVGALYFYTVSQAALAGKIDWRQSLIELPRKSLQIILLALMWLAIFIAVSIPGSCLVSIAILIEFSLGQFFVLLFGGFLLWLFFPLLFSAHGIFVHGQDMWNSLKSGFRLTRLTFPMTGMFFLTVLIFSKGLDLLWVVPQEDNWLSLVGIFGHAFVTTGLLAASFIYYQSADQWVEDTIKRRNGVAIDRSV